MSDSDCFGRICVHQRPSYSKKCVDRSVAYDGECFDSRQCTNNDLNSVCQRTTDSFERDGRYQRSKCQCKDGYEPDLWDIEDKKCLGVNYCRSNGDCTSAKPECKVSSNLCEFSNEPAIGGGALIAIIVGSVVVVVLIIVISCVLISKSRKNKKQLTTNVHFTQHISVPPPINLNEPISRPASMFVAPAPPQMTNLQRDPPTNPNFVDESQNPDRGEYWPQAMGSNQPTSAATAPALRY